MLKGDDGQEDVAGECEIKRGGGSAVAVPVLLPWAGITFVVVAIFHGPMLSGGVGGAGFLVSAEAGKEKAGVAFRRRQRVFLLRPVALNRDGRAGARQAGADWGNGCDGTATPVQTPVLALLAQFKRGVPLRACVAPARRLEVFSLVPMR